MAVALPSLFRASVVALGVPPQRMRTDCRRSRFFAAATLCCSPQLPVQTRCLHYGPFGNRLLPLAVVGRFFLFLVLVFIFVPVVVFVPVLILPVVVFVPIFVLVFVLVFL
jgi:hypothetical protein